jgi:hypothetical protein
VERLLWLCLTAWQLTEAHSAFVFRLDRSCWERYANQLQSSLLSGSQPLIMWQTGRYCFVNLNVATNPCLVEMAIISLPSPTMTKVLESPMLSTVVPVQF